MHVSDCFETHLSELSESIDRLSALNSGGAQEGQIRAETLHIITTASDVLIDAVRADLPVESETEFDDWGGLFEGLLIQLLELYASWPDRDVPADQFMSKRLFALLDEVN